MIAQCPSCDTKYKVSEANVRGRGARITCPTCTHKFVIYRRDGQYIIEDQRPAGTPVASFVKIKLREDEEAEMPTTLAAQGSKLAQEVRQAFNDAESTGDEHASPAAEEVGDPVSVSTNKQAVKDEGPPTLSELRRRSRATQSKQVVEVPDREEPDPGRVRLLLAGLLIMVVLLQWGEALTEMVNGPPPATPEEVLAPQTPPPTPSATPEAQATDAAN